MADASIVVASLALLAGATALRLTYKLKHALLEAQEHARQMAGGAVAAAKAELADQAKELGDSIVQTALGQGEEIIKQAEDTLARLRSEAGRVRALIRHRGRVDDDEPDESTGTLPDFLANLARGAGLDVELLNAGNEDEWRRAMELLGKRNGAAEAAPQQPAIAYL